MVVPTRVGMIPAAVAVCGALGGGPHACGDDPSDGYCILLHRLWSPRVWG